MMHPKAKLLSALFAVIGTSIIQQPIYLIAIWLLMLTSLIFVEGLAKRHVQFLFKYYLPIAIILHILWGWVVGAPPGENIGSDPIKGTQYATIIALKLLVFSTIFQVTLSTISPDKLGYTLKSLGIGGEWLFIIVGTVALLPEVRIRAGQIIDATLARGLVANRGIWAMGRQFPFVLRTLFAWLLRSAIHRSENWKQRGFWKHSEIQTREGAYSQLSSTVMIIASSLWVLIAIYSRMTK